MSSSFERLNRMIQEAAVENPTIVSTSQNSQNEMEQLVSALSDSARSAGRTALDAMYSQSEKIVTRLLELAGRLKAMTNEFEEYGYPTDTVLKACAHEMHARLFIHPDHQPLLERLRDGLSEKNRLATEGFELIEDTREQLASLGSPVQSVVKGRGR